MHRVCSPKEFLEILDCERSRSDRTGRGFSLVIFEVEKPKDAAALPPLLCSLLTRKVRCYDEIGWIDEQHIGAILPATPVEGALRFADNICRFMTPKECHPKYSVIVYPFHWMKSKREVPHPHGGTDSSPNASIPLTHDNINFFKEFWSVLPV